MKTFFALSIAGSDSSSGAGVQADLKTFYKLKVPGISVITAITAQNSKGVFSIHPIPPKEIKAQLKVLEEDFSIKAAKVGMIPNIEALFEISKFFKRRRDLFFLLDPVLISTSGSKLFLEDTRESLKKNLIPLCNLITPNIDEAKALLDEDFKDQREIIYGFYKKFKIPILLKGGHLEKRFIKDIFFDGNNLKIYKWKKLKDEFHGTGCILSSAIISYIVKGFDLNQSIERGLKFLHKIIKKPAPFNTSIKYLLY